MQMFEIQSNNAGASAQADVFSNADYSAAVGNGSTLNGVSAAELDDATIGAAGDAAAQLLILGVSRDPKNDEIGAANVNWRVMINMHLLGHGVGTVGA
jgi:Ni,Fe-hydrogenase I small subunit